MFDVALIEVQDPIVAHLTHHGHVQSRNENGRHNKEYRTASMTLFRKNLRLLEVFLK